MRKTAAHVPLRVHVIPGLPPNYRVQCSCGGEVSGPTAEAAGLAYDAHVEAVAKVSAGRGESDRPRTSR
jgi:hypothetical protein